MGQSENRCACYLATKRTAVVETNTEEFLCRLKSSPGGVLQTRFTCFICMPALVYFLPILRPRSLLQATSYAAFPFLGEAGSPTGRFGVLFRTVAPSCASLSSHVLSCRAVAGMGHDSSEENRGAFQGDPPGRRRLT